MNIVFLLISIDFARFIDFPILCETFVFASEHY
jgi:hypothetical protein